MGKTGLFYDIKKIVPDLIDNNGNFRTMPIGVFNKVKVPKKTVEIFKSFLALLKNTNIIHDETKLYLFNPYITLKEVNEEINSRYNKKLVLNTTISKVGQDRMKIVALVGDDFVHQIISSKFDYDMYAHIIAEQSLKYKEDGVKDLRDNLLLPLNRDIINYKLSDEDFDTFLDIVKPYMKSHIDTLARNIDEKMIGYFNNLIVNHNLSEKDKERYELLLQFLGEWGNRYERDFNA